MMWVITKLGENLSVFLMTMVLVFIIGYVDFWWTCGLCGKRNKTGFFKMFFCMCDHFGDF